MFGHEISSQPMLEEFHTVESDADSMPLYPPTASRVWLPKHKGSIQPVMDDLFYLQSSFKFAVNSCPTLLKRNTDFLRQFAIQAVGPG